MVIVFGWWSGMPYFCKYIDPIRFKKEKKNSITMFFPRNKIAILVDRWRVKGFRHDRHANDNCFPSFQAWICIKFTKRYFSSISIKLKSIWNLMYIFSITLIPWLPCLIFQFEWWENMIRICMHFKDALWIILFRFHAYE